MMGMSSLINICGTELTDSTWQLQALLNDGFADFRLIESHALIYLGRRIFADYQILVE